MKVGNLVKTRGVWGSREHAIIVDIHKRIGGHHSYDIVFIRDGFKKYNLERSEFELVSGVD
jgi:hypothetical protein